MDTIDKALAGVGSLLILLMIGAVFGRLHAKENSGFQPLGDRVACGLFALPLISIAVRLLFPEVPVGWALAAPLPVLVFVVLLAGVDLGWRVSRQYFTLALVAGVGMIYAVMAAVATMS
jgi:hypothetical protein